MTININKFVAIWVACALLLCGAFAGAEGQADAAPAGESEGWRLSNDMSVDFVLFQSLLDRLCPEKLMQLKAKKVGVLLNAVEPSLTVSGDGFQLDVDLNGTNALSIGATRTEDGIAIASTLFPSYAISVSTGKIMQIVSDIRPMTAKPKISPKAAEAAPPSQSASPEAAADGEEAAPSDPDSDDALPVDQMSGYVSASQPESGAFQANGIYYDVRRTYSLDCNGIVGVWNTLVNWIFDNKGIASLLEIAKKAELEIDIDRVKALVPTDSLPRFSATFLSSSTTADRFITATAASDDGTKAYGDAMIQITEDDVTANLHIPILPLDIDFELHRAEGLQAALDVRGKESLLYATFDADGESLHGQIDLPALQSDARFVLTQPAGELTGRLEINAGGNYLGSDFALTPFDDSGNGLRLTANLYYTDPANPLFREQLVLQPRGDLTLDFTGAEKTLVPITSLINVSNGYLAGFALDILFNGIGGLMDATSNVLLQLNRSAGKGAA